MSWEGGDPAESEVRLRQGSTPPGEPWFFRGDVVLLSVPVRSESFFA